MSPLTVGLVAVAFDEKVTGDGGDIRSARGLDAAARGGFRSPPLHIGNCCPHPDHRPCRAKPALKFPQDYPLERVCRRLGNDVRVSFDCHRDNCVLLLVDR